MIEPLYLLISIGAIAICAIVTCVLALRLMRIPKARDIMMKDESFDIPPCKRIELMDEVDDIINKR